MLSDDDVGELAELVDDRGDLSIGEVLEDLAEEDHIRLRWQGVFDGIDAAEYQMIASVCGVVLFDKDRDDVGGDVMPKRLMDSLADMKITTAHVEGGFFVALMFRRPRVDGIDVRIYDAGFARSRTRGEAVVGSFPDSLLVDPGEDFLRAALVIIAGDPASA